MISGLVLLVFSVFPSTIQVFLSVAALAPQLFSVTLLTEKMQDVSLRLYVV